MAASPRNTYTPETLRRVGPILRVWLGTGIGQSQLFRSIRNAVALICMISIATISPILTAVARICDDIVAAISKSNSGSTPRPGEISLAHHGVLFLDELPEFDRRVLESLREPLESGRIHISRAARQAEFPARFQLVAAMNPCPCGHHGAPSGRCRCTPEQVARYRGKLSGPLLDRIDLCIEVPAVPAESLQQAPDGEPSQVVRARVAAALVRQHARQGKPNAQLAPHEIDAHCRPDAAGAALLQQAAARLGLSARAFHRVQKVARTIADLAGADSIAAAHVAEAVQLRRQASQE
ncbi:ATP-binding protein [Azospira restricta]